ncbi:MAG TPA: hypothetical protein VIS48_10460 [Candidatus Kryptonia bacterium]
MAKSLIEIFRLSLFLTTASVILLGCSKKSSNTLQAQYDTTGGTWQVDPSLYRLDKILLNGAVHGNDYTVAGLQTVSRFDTSSIAPSIELFFPTQLNLSTKPEYCGDFWAYGTYGGREAEYLFVPSTATLIGTDTTVRGGFYEWWFNMHDLDSSFSTDAVPSAIDYQFPVGAFNDLGQFFTCVLDSDGASLCLMDLNARKTLTVGYEPFIALSPVVKKIEPDVSDKFSGQTFLISSYKDNFFIAMGNNDYIIHSNGTARILPDILGRFYDMFNYNDTLYAMTEAAAIYRSTNNGENWTQFGSFSDPTFRNCRFFQVDSNMFFYVYSQIARIDLATGVYQEIDDRGLEYNEITSVNKFGRNVYVTTLSGLFYKPASKFLTYLPQSATASRSLKLLKGKVAIHR